MRSEVEWKPIGMEAVRNRLNHVKDSQKDNLEAQVPSESGSVAGVRPRVVIVNIYKTS